MEIIRFKFRFLYLLWRMEYRGIRYTAGDAYEFHEKPPIPGTEIVFPENFLEQLDDNGNSDVDDENAYALYATHVLAWVMGKTTEDFEETTTLPLDIIDDLYEAEGVVERIFGVVCMEHGEYAARVINITSGDFCYDVVRLAAEDKILQALADPIQLEDFKDGRQCAFPLVENMFTLAYSDRSEVRDAINTLLAAYDGGCDTGSLKDALDTAFLGYPPVSEFLKHYEECRKQGDINAINALAKFIGKQ